MNLGPVLVHGVPGCGKSWKARELALAASAATGWPIVVHDPAKSIEIWGDVPHAVTLGQVLDEVYTHGRHVAWSTQQRDDVDRLAGALNAAGGAVFVLDELCYVSGPNSAPDNLVYLFRGWRHAGEDTGVAIVAATQRINDCCGDLICACSRVLTGRCLSPRILAYLRDNYRGLDPDEVAGLERGVFRETVTGM